MNALDAFDYRLFALLNSWAGIYPLFDGVVRFLASYLIWLIVPVALIIPCIRLSKREALKRLLVMGSSFVLARLVITELFRHFLYRNRPFLTYTVTQLIPKPSVASFPSGHTVAVVSLGAALYWYNRKAGIAVVALGVIIGIARVIAGVHYPADIIGGIAIGLFTGYVSGKIVKPYIKEKYI